MTRIQFIKYSTKTTTQKNTTQKIYHGNSTCRKIQHKKYNTKIQHGKYNTKIKHKIAYAENYNTKNITQNTTQKFQAGKIYNTKI